MPRMITLTCPSCGAKARISDDATRLHCDHCGNDHLLQINLTPLAPEQKPPLRPLQPMPGNVWIEQDDVSWRIVQRWFSFKFVPLAFFALVWIGFLVFWYSIALSTGELMMLLFPLVHVAVGVWLGYSTLAGFVNRTTVELYQDNLVVRFDPLPWPGEKTVPVHEITQLFCKETVKHSKRSSRTVYHLYAVKHDGYQVKLLGNVDAPEIVLFLEQQLESWLHISDQPVVGEIK